MALRIELLAKQVVEFDNTAIDWGERREIAVTEEAAERVRKAGLPLTAAFCHPKVLQLRPHLLLWYRGLAMMSRKELSGDTRGAEEKAKAVGEGRAAELALVLNRHICAVLSVGDVTLADLKGIVYSTVGATLQGKWGNEIGKIQVVFEEFVLDQLATMGELREVRTSRGWVPWSREGLRDMRVVSARLRGGRFVEFGSNPDVAVFDREEEPSRLIVCAMEVKGGTDESNAYYRLADAAETLQRSRHANERCFTIMVSDSIIAPVSELLKKEPYASLVDSYYGVSQLLSDEEAQKRFAADLRRVLHIRQ